MPSRSSRICVQDRVKTVAICEKYTNYYMHNNITFETMFLKAWNEDSSISWLILPQNYRFFIFVSVGLDLSKWVALTLFRGHI